MDKIEEMLEREQAEGTGYGIPSEAYAEEEWEQQKVKGWPRQIHVFGLRQNQINLGTAARLRALEIQNRTLEIKIQRLEEELETLGKGKKDSGSRGSRNGCHAGRNQPSAPFHTTEQQCTGSDS